MNDIHNDYLPNAMDQLWTEVVRLRDELEEAWGKAKDYDALLKNYNTLVVDMSKVAERKRTLESKVDMLNDQLDAALTDRTVERDRVAGLHRANSDLRAENARRRNENKGLEVTLQDCREEIQQRNEEIAELKRARLYSIPTRYIVGSDSREAACARAKQLEEENARLEADNARLEELVGKLDKAVAKRDERISYAEDALATARKERDEVCDYRVHDLEALNEQTSISLERVRQDLFNAQATLLGVRNAVK
jgi:chromosome segregation ATPase